MTPKKNVPRPDHVFIGHMTFQIAWLSEDEWDDRRLGLDLRGLTDHMKAFIGIRLMPSSPEAMYQETLVHELSHAIWAVLGLNHNQAHYPNDEREEAIIVQQSPAWLFCLQNNPTLVAYLMSDGTVERRG